MADEAGPTAELLIARMREKPFGFDFFHALRLLECAHADRPRFGTSTRTEDDPVRFGQDPSLRFAPATLSAFHPAPGSLAPEKPGVSDMPRRPHRLRVEFMGMLGPSGPLPLHLTDYARERRIGHRDTAFVDFLDLFNHRFLSLFYRAWATSQKTVSHDRPSKDRFLAFFGSVFGLGTAGMHRRDSVPDIAKIHYAGRLGPRVRNAQGLRSILRDAFGVPAEVLQFIGQWITLPDDTCCRLGESPDTGALGQTAIVGRRVWDCQMKFRIRLGPLAGGDFTRFLPGHRDLQRLRDWVRNYIGDELDWDLQLVLDKQSVPATRLGQAGRLGWTTWLGQQPRTQDADDLTLRPNAA